MTGLTSTRRGKHAADPGQAADSAFPASVRDTVPPASALDLIDRLLYRATHDWGTLLRHLLVLALMLAALSVIDDRLHWPLALAAGGATGALARAAQARRRSQRGIR
jgi:hypothetical protein